MSESVADEFIVAAADVTFYALPRNPSMEEMLEEKEEGLVATYYSTPNTNTSPFPP